jgi:prevent-host-death family protein
MVDLSMSQARIRLRGLVRRAAVDHERVTITHHGQPAAVLVNAEELADLEEALALATYRTQQAAGKQRMVLHADALELLGLRRSDPTVTGANPPAA